MKRPTFIEGTGVAVVASAAGGILFSGLGSMFMTGAVSRLLVAAISLVYVVYLLSRSGERVGRITILSVWLVMAVTAWLWSPSLPVYLLLHVGMLWLVRSLYFHSSVLTSLADLGLSGFSAAAAVWAVVETGSIFLGIWCFFLAQALFVFIPAAIDGGKSRSVNTTANDRFEQAYREAETALRKFSSPTNSRI